MGLLAYILVLAEAGREPDILTALRKLPIITEAQMVYGEFDIVARSEFNHLNELDDAIATIRRITGIIRTTTLISTT